MLEIEKLNRITDDFVLLTGIEGNIGGDGGLDLDNDLLRDLDVVVASVHSGFKQTEREITERVLTAMHNEHVDIIGHPTGRLIQQRDPYRIDLPAIFEAAADLGVFLEINAFPRRLDLSDQHCMAAHEHGALFSLGSDAHNRNNLRYMEFGISIARRGWLEKKDIVNTLHPNELLALLQR
jgi:DNA polymerase (family 10)